MPLKRVVKTESEGIALRALKNGVSRKSSPSTAQIHSTPPSLLEKAEWIYMDSMLMPRAGSDEGRAYMSSTEWKNIYDLHQRLYDNLNLPYLSQTQPNQTYLYSPLLFETSFLFSTKGEVATKGADSSLRGLLTSPFSRLLQLQGHLSKGQSCEHSLTNGTGGDHAMFPISMSPHGASTT